MQGLRRRKGEVTTAVIAPDPAWQASTPGAPATWRTRTTRTCRRCARCSSPPRCSRPSPPICRGLPRSCCARCSRVHTPPPPSQAKRRTLQLYEETYAAPRRQREAAARLAEQRAMRRGRVVEKMAVLFGAIALATASAAAARPGTLANVSVSSATAGVRGALAHVISATVGGAARIASAGGALVARTGSRGAL